MVFRGRGYGKYAIAIDPLLVGSSSDTVIFMRKVITAGAAIGILLAGCTDADTATESISESPPSTHVAHVDEVVQPLADTPWKCVDWFTTDAGDFGRCGFEFTPGKHSVHVTKDPEMLAAVIFDDLAGVESVVIGENWLFACEDPLVADDCDYLAGLMGGEMIEPGHWSS